MSSNPTKSVRSPTGALDPHEARRVREIIREHGPAAAGKMLGNVDVRTITKAASEAPVSRLSATVIRALLLEVDASPSPGSTTPKATHAAAAAPVPAPVAPVAPVAPSPPDEPPVALYRTIALTQGRKGVQRAELAEFSSLESAERGFKIDRRAHELLEVATGRILRSRPFRGAWHALKDDDDGGRI